MEKSIISDLKIERLRETWVSLCLKFLTIAIRVSFENPIMNALKFEQSTFPIIADFIWKLTAKTVR